MAKLKLYGSVGSREIEVQPRVVCDDISDTDTARRQSFAIVKSLLLKLEKVGITEKVLWDYILSSHEVSSRKDLSELEWVRLAARLSAAEKNKQLLDVLVSEIKAAAGECRAYREHSDGTFKKVYEGLITADIEQRCQAHADKSGCVVRLHGSDGSDGIVFFEPKEYVPDPKCPPVPEIDLSKPARVFEVQCRVNETHYIELPFPDASDLLGWGQHHADSTGFEVLMTACDGKTPLLSFEPSIDVVYGANDVTIEGVKWILLNQWEDKWHWVKHDRSMERHIAQAESKTEAVASLLEYVKNSR